MTRKNGQKGFQQKTFSSARRVSETQRQQAQLNQRRGGPVVPRNAPVVARNQPVVAAVLPVRGGGAPRGGRAGAGGRGGARRSARLVARAPAAADEPAAIHFAEAVEPELVNLEEGVAVNGSVEPAEVSIISRPTPGENIASVASQKDSSENLTSSGPVIKRLKVDKGTSPFAPPRNPASLAVPNSSAMNEGNVVVQLAPNQPNLWTPPEFIFLNGRRYRLESVDVGMEEGPTDAAGADPNSSAMRTDVNSSYVVSPAASPATLAILAERAAFINARNTVADSPAVSSQDHRAGNDVAPSPAVSSQGGRLSQASLATVSWSSRTDASSSRIDSPAVSSSTLASMAERAAFINARNTVADSPAVSSQDHRAGNDVAPSPAVSSQGGRLSQASLATVPWSSRTDANSVGVNSPALSSSTLGLMTGVSPNMPRAVDLNTSELRSPHFDFSNISTVDVAIGRNMSDDRERTASSERDVSVSVTVNAYDLELDNSVGSVADGSRTAGRPSQLSSIHSIASDEPTGEPTIAPGILNHRHIEPTPDPNAPKPMPTFEVFSEREPRDFTILHNRANEIEIGTGVEELRSPGSRRRSPLNPTLGMTPTASELLHSVRLPLTSPTEHLDNSAGVETNGKETSARDDSLININSADGSASPPAVVGHGVGRLSSSVVSNATHLDPSATAPTSPVRMSASPSAEDSNDVKTGAHTDDSTGQDKTD